MENSLSVVPQQSALIPAPVLELGEDAARAFVNFFTARIRNANTRECYLRNIRRFMGWVMGRGYRLEELEPFHVAAYIEELGKTLKPSSVKQHLAALRVFGRYLVVKQIVSRNPAAEVEAPKVVIRTGLTPVMQGADARTLLESIDVTRPAGMRDRALIGAMIYTFGRISAVVNMDVEDYVQVGRLMKLQLREKGGKVISAPAHHTLVEYMDEYLTILDRTEGPLFPTVNRTRDGFTDRRLHRNEAWAMVKRRCRQTGLGESFCNHTFRATGITAYLKNDGELAKAQFMAAHASIRTTRIYDRREEEVTLDEVERIIL